MESCAIDTKELKVVKVTKTHFDLSDGRTFQHVVELDEVPDLEEFQQIYDHWKHIFSPEDGQPSINFSDS